MMEMTPQEIQAEMLKVMKEVGPHARLFVSINGYPRDGSIHVSLYPEGMAKDSAFTFYANDWAEVFSETRARWAVDAAKHRKKAVRKIALAIIRRTAEEGVCTDAALRGEFADEEINTLGAEAVEDANRIASNGPFSITKLAGANAA